CSGVWPPSNPARTVLRAYWPFVPRPAVLPWPEPIPRPSRFVLWTAPGAGFSSPRFILVGLFNREEVRDFLDHPADLSVVGLDCGLVHLSQTQPLHRRTELLRRADGAANQRDLNLCGHSETPRRSPGRGGPAGPPARSRGAPPHARRCAAHSMP